MTLLSLTLCSIVCQWKLTVGDESANGHHAPCELLGIIEVIYGAYFHIDFDLLQVALLIVNNVLYTILPS